MVSCPSSDEAAIMSSNYYQLPLNMDRICRICLNENSTLVPIFDQNQESDFSRKIQICGSIEIEAQDGLPSLICNVCRYKVNVAQEFRDLCQQSDAKLRLLYNKPAKCKVIDESTQTESQPQIVMSKSRSEVQEDYFVKQEQQNLNSQLNSVIYAGEDIVAELQIHDDKMFFDNMSLDNSAKTETTQQSSDDIIHSEPKDKSSVKEMPTTILESQSNQFISNIEDSQSTTVQKRTSTRKTKGVSRCADFSDNDDDFFGQTNENDQPEKKFHCDICGKQCATQNGLKKHSQVHEKKHCCEICSKAFHKTEDLESHKKSHIDGSDTTRSKEAEDDNDEEEDDELDKQPMLFKCEVCGQVYSSLKNMKRHAMNHGEKKYSCTVCQKWFFRPDTLKKHAEKHGHGLLDNLDDDNKLYDSDDDPFPTTTETERKKDESEEENATGEYKCQHCDKVMATKKGLRRHVSMHKPKAEPVTCEICKKVCASQARLVLHQKTHNKPKERPPREYLCHICSKVYPSNSSLTYHMRTHTGIKPHVCKTCNSGFTTTTSLANHIRIHTGDKPFVCHVCSAAFAVSSAFRRHLTRHTGEANYLCKTCGKAFKRLSTLKEHTYTHSGEKPYVCKTCGAAYSHSGSLFAHQKRCRAQYSEMVVEDHRTVTPHIHVNNLQTAVRSLAVIGQMF